MKMRTITVLRQSMAKGAAFLLVAGACHIAISQPASAATGPTAAMATANAPAPDITPAQVVSAGDEIIRMVDQFRFADLWNSASPATRKVAQQAQFSSDLASNRQPLGAVSSRSWQLLARQTLGADKGVIAGQYLNIEYETRFAKGEVRRELVSFRFDEDRIWRFAGYVLR